jgi:hypothetical protein
MAKKKKQLPAKFQVWIDARKRFRLSDAHIQMARELGLNPKKLGGLANHDQERWKSPLPEFIEDLYFERFGKERPDNVFPIGDKVRHPQSKKLESPKVPDRDSPTATAEDTDLEGPGEIPF